jgi:ABC-type antimicrobial peptide transport system permease subunit
MALGAKPGSVLTMFMRETIWVLGPGVALGLLAALTTTRLLESMLFGVKPADPVSIIVATVVLGATAAFAAYIPARRASRLDPMVTLRE